MAGRGSLMAGWRASVEAYIRAEAQPKDKFGHQPRLYALACRLGEGMEYDGDTLYAAAWMHDLGVFLGHRPTDPAELAGWDHVPYTVARTRELLIRWGFPTEKLEGVAEAIRTHRPQDEPVLTEAVLLRDADILEQLGAMGVLRAVAKVGRDTRYETFTSVMGALEKTVDELPECLRLAISKDLAIRRVQFVRQFLAMAAEESAENLG